MPTSITHHTLADRGLKLWAITKDPLTLSAAKILLQTNQPPTTEPETTAQALLQRQLAAYEVLFYDDLV